MKVLLADDHALFRAGLATLLDAWGLEVVGQAGDGNEAVAKARELHPDVIFMDINMPNSNGLEATRAIVAEFPDIRVVILTVSEDENYLFEAIKSGAVGYLLKNLREQEFADLVHALERGEPVMSPGLAKKLLSEFARIKNQPDVEAGSGLTNREQEVLEELAKGKTNREISTALYISENTVNYHMKNILSKLHLKNRSQVIAWAIENGIVSKPTDA